MHFNQRTPSSDIHGLVGWVWSINSNQTAVDRQVFSDAANPFIS